MWLAYSPHLDVAQDLIKNQYIFDRFKVSGGYIFLHVCLMKFSKWQMFVKNVVWKMVVQKKRGEKIADSSKDIKT